MNPWIRPANPLIIAHRGYSLVAPENTLPAYQKAIEVGVDMIEADVNLTKDGVLVMIHDYFLDRTIDATGNVSDYTFEEIRRMDAGVKFHPEFSGTRIPTAEETIQLAKEAGILMCFEIKGGDPRRATTISQKLMQLFDSHEAYEWAFISSYFPEASAAAKQIAPQVQVAREWLPDNAPIDFPEAMTQVGEAKSPVLMLDYVILNENVLPFFHSQEIAVWAWNPYKREDIEGVIQLGVDGVMGDNPELAMKLVGDSKPLSRV
jgi:glycerophosphoryl diester phosphodiesterase